MPETARPAAARDVPWRSVALPVEHGGWSFLFEPVVLGLVLSPSLSGALLGLAALAGFLVRHPLRLVALDRRKGASYPRTALALRFAAAYAGLAAAFAGLALAVLLVAQVLRERRPEGAGSRWNDPAFVLRLLWPMYLVHQFEEHGIDLLGRHYSFLGELCRTLGHAADPSHCPADPAFIFAVRLLHFSTQVTAISKPSRAVSVVKKAKKKLRSSVRLV